MLHHFRKRAAKALGLPYRGKRLATGLKLGRSSRLAFEPLEHRMLLATGPLLMSPWPIISEFMANNDETLPDGYGNYPDWIEIHNPTESAVSLNGWYLTDNAGDLTKWSFPDVSIGADEYLVVFASNQDGTDPVGFLHTNFQLSNSGEYLALVLPDGTTVAHEYAPEYPQQAPEVSYGVTDDIAGLYLPGGSELTYAVPGDGSLGTDWIESGFDDSAWTAFIDVPGVLITEAATGNPDSVEIQNVSADPIDTSGWVVAVNDAHDVNLVHTTLWELPDSMAAGEVRYRSDDPAEEDEEEYWGASIYWTTSGSGWVMLIDDLGNIVDFVAWGYSDVQIDSIEIDVNGFENITVGGEWNGLGVPAEGEPTNSLQRTGDSDYNNAVDWHFVTPKSEREQNESLDVPFVIGLVAPIGFDAGSTGIGSAVLFDVEAEMYNVNPSIYARYPFYVDSPTALDEVVLWVKYNDGFVAYVNGQEVARDNAPVSPVWNSSATEARSVEESLEYVGFDISAYLDAFVQGANVLAIQGLNVAAGEDGDDDFLIEVDMAGLGLRYFPMSTPGEANGPGVSILGPFIRDVTENPPPPASDEDLLITAEVTPAFHPVDYVTLHYRVNFDVEYTAPMVDDGTGQDAVAGDHVFTGIIPELRYEANDMLRWYVTATDTLAAESRAPMFFEQMREHTSQSPEYFGTVVPDPSLVTPLSVFQYFVEDVNRSQTTAGTRASVYFLGEFYDNVFVRARGRVVPGIKFQFNDGHLFRFDPEQPRDDTINLNTEGPNDRSYLRQVLSWEVYRDAGAPGSFSFLTHTRRNGEYLDIHTLIEQPDHHLLDRAGLDETGSLYKMWNEVTAAYSGVEKKNRQWEDNSDLEVLVGVVNPSNPNRAIEIFDHVDIPEVINYIAATSIIHENDAPHKNYYLYRETETTGEWGVLPWDKDLTFGLNHGISGIIGNVDPFSHPRFGDSDHPKVDGYWNRLIDAIMDTPATLQMYMRRLRTLMDELLQPAGTPYAERYIEQRMDYWESAMLADGSFIENSTWHTALNQIRGEYLSERREHLYITHGPDGSGEIPDSQPASFDVDFGEIDFNPVSGNQDEEYIRLDNPNSFAVDISRWRMTGAVEHTFKPGTVIAANSSLYVTPNAIAFRARTTGPSGGQGLLVQGNYGGHLSSFGETVQLLDADGVEVNSYTYEGEPSPGQQFLRITEIMYNPPQPTADEILGGGSTDNEDYEYIELVNTDASKGEALNLDGVYFSQGITFTFGAMTLDPGERILVVQDQDAFEARYGPGLNIAGEFTDGKLNNDGEQIKLEDADNGTVHNFAYNDTGGWPQWADGHGASLEVIDTEGDYDDPTNWRAGSELGGSPGGAGDGPVGNIVINEVLSNSDGLLVDAIELHNTSGEAIEIGGWWLSDSSDNFEKYQIPSLTSIPGGGYIVFDESQFNPAEPGPGQVAFALNGAEGDDVWLMKGEVGGGATHFVDQVEFGAALSGESFGRWENSEGKLYFYPMTSRTLDPPGPNSGPRIGPELIISEVMYNPPDPDGDGGIDTADLEFIEIYNTAGYPVVLTDWQLRKGIDFDFAPGTMLDSGEALVVVGFDPDTEPAKLADFQGYYGIDGSVQIVGGHSSRLDDDGERVQLQDWDTPVPGPPPITPHPLEDEVDYKDTWHPSTDGLGESLNRLGSSHWGDEPASWFAAAPTPGMLETEPLAEVAGRHVFYNNSAFDTGPGNTDDHAIVPDKTALMPGGTATFANYTSYSHGINGIMIDVFDLKDPVGLSATDFGFKAGNDNDPSGWDPMVAVPTVAVRPGEGTDGSDRIVLIWPDGDIEQQWLEVTVAANNNTGLAEPDVFYFGNAIGETGNSTNNAIVDVQDVLATHNNPHPFWDPAEIDNSYDFDRNRRVDVVDVLIAQDNQTWSLTALKLIDLSGGKGVATASGALGHDVVLGLANEQEANGRAALSAKAAWLYEYEGPGARGEGRGRTETVAKAVDKLLAIYWQ